MCFLVGLVRPLKSEASRNTEENVFPVQSDPKHSIAHCAEVPHTQLCVRLLGSGVAVMNREINASRAGRQPKIGNAFVGSWLFLFERVRACITTLHGDELSLD